MIVERIVLLILFCLHGYELLTSLVSLDGVVHELVGSRWVGGRCQSEKFVSNTNTSDQSLLGLWLDRHH
jgi:hypothetical protein